MQFARRNIIVSVGICLLVGGGSTSVSAQTSSTYPSLEKVTEGYTKVVSTADGKQSFYTIWIRERDGQMLAELPKDFARQKHFIALTISSGSTYAGLQSGERYVYWRQYDKRLALISPNLEIRSSGDQESKSSIKRLFTDKVMLDVPILTYVPRGGPVIDMDALLVGQATSFFGSSARSSKPNLIKIKKAKAFPSNVELAFEVPNPSGTLQTLHYSFSLIPDNTGYTPRLADERVGYFTTAFSDLGKYKDDETRVRYINRWHLEKRDSKLEISPPKKPIVFYLEHTTPVRYRRWVRQGVEYWNKAFENVGISNAIEVYYQDESTGAHMEFDPEDVRYNFVRWLNNNVGTAIGPSRVHPMTGQILDADIILTDGWIRHFEKNFNKVMPKIAMEGMSAETMAWIAEHPNWDPRIRMAPPSQRPYLMQEFASKGRLPYGGHALAAPNTTLLGDDTYDGLIGRTSQVNGLCLAAEGKSFDIAFMRMAMKMSLAAAQDKAKKKAKKDEDDKVKNGKKSQKEGDDKEGDDDEGDDEGDDEDKDGDDDDDDDSDDKSPDGPIVDGMPESFIGPLLADLVAHEVGHTLGLRHNFKASSLYSLEEMNSEDFKGETVFAGSVMDYLPVNFNMKSGAVQGDYAMIDIGPYDFWAIEYGYTFDKDLKPILERVSEPELVFATDEDTSGPDPLARRYDFGKNPLEYAKSQMELAKYHRERIIEEYVEDGESWAKAREGYEMTLSMQTRATSMMANWIGGAFVHRDKKGDKGDRIPVKVVEAAKQRDALTFVIDNTFRDEAFGLSVELINRMSVDKWLDGDGAFFAVSNEATWPIHDRIMGIQASTLTQLMNPTTLRRVYDNEFRVPTDEDTVTLPEIFEKIKESIWSELESKSDAKFSDRQPMISSFRRNLQREHLERLFDLTMPNQSSNSAYKPISNLATMQLKTLLAEVNKGLERKGLDTYTKAHLGEAVDLIERHLNSDVVYNNSSRRSSGSIIFLRSPDEEQEEK